MIVPRVVLEQAMVHVPTHGAKQVIYPQVGEDAEGDNVLQAECRRTHRPRSHSAREEGGQRSRHQIVQRPAQQDRAERRRRQHRGGGEGGRRNNVDILRGTQGLRRGGQRLDPGARRRDAQDLEPPLVALPLHLPVLASHRMGPFGHSHRCVLFKILGPTHLQERSHKSGRLHQSDEHARRGALPPIGRQQPALRQQLLEEMSDDLRSLVQLFSTRGRAQAE
mmetsp:Transcript_170479/g.546731  ORF Transcript_170479/g.546731 Transcript_170479/m.546731 type:complete len:222 (+) Transcript_170479:5253-5918(+)